MKNKYKAGIVLWMGMALALRVLAVQVEERPFVDGNVYEIGVHVHTSLTVVLPKEILAIQGAGYVGDASQAQGNDYLLQHTPGQKFFSIVALHRSAAPRNLNVLCQDGSIIVIVPIVVAQTRFATSVMRFTEGPPEVNLTANGEALRPELTPEDEERLRETVRAASIEISDRVPDADDERAQTNTYLNIFSTLQLLVGYRDRPEIIQQIVDSIQSISLSLRQSDVTDMTGYLVEIYAVMRHHTSDTIALAIGVQNVSDETFRVDPRSIVVRTGNRVYPVAFASFPSAIKAGETVTGHIAISRNENGGREELSVERTFQISLQPLATDEPE